jgi:hypothetical protein
MRRAYLFAAEGIQRWVMEGDKLRDIAAASALLAWTANSDENDLLALVLDQTQFAARPSRRAGGVFMLHFDDDAIDPFDRFRALWRLAFMRLLPGLEFVEALSPGMANDGAAADEAYKPENQLSRGRENGPASLLPLGHPLSRLAPRTGRPATHLYKKSDEVIDAATEAKRRANGFRDEVGERLAEGLRPSIRWPNLMPADPDDQEDPGQARFPIGEDDWIAVAHADVSGLGEFFRKVRNGPTSVETVNNAAKAIEEAVMAAARTAAAKTLFNDKILGTDGIVPARPVLLGGDDITLILRGDVAIPFMACFLEALEVETEARIGERLTAGAGIAFGGAKQPFFRLLRLADGLCGYAKGKAKMAAASGARPASVLAFWRGTESALSAEAAILLTREPKSCQPYCMGSQPAPNLPTFSGLKALCAALDSEPLQPGRLRDVRSLLAKPRKPEAAESRNLEADEVWARWRQIATRRGGESALEKLDDGLRRAWNDPLLDTRDATCLAPAFDAMDWLAIEGLPTDRPRLSTLENAA